MSSEQQVYARAIRVTIIALATLAILGVAGAALFAGSQGAVAALAGVGVAAVSGISSQVAIKVGSTGSANYLAGVFGATWLAKMAFIIVVLFVLKGVENFHRPAFVIVASAGILATLLIDVWVIRSADIPYVDTSSKSSEE